MWLPDTSLNPGRSKDIFREIIRTSMYGYEREAKSYLNDLFPDPHSGPWNYMYDDEPIPDADEASNNVAEDYWPSLQVALEKLAFCAEALEAI